MTNGLKGMYKKKTQVDDGFQLDTRRGDKGPKLEESVEKINAKIEKAKEARLGYVRLDIIEHKPRIKFGKWNPRTIVSQQITSLVESFRVNGLHRFNYDYGIPIVVDPEWLVEGTYTETAGDARELPVLRIGARAPAGWALDAAGGQHRSEALSQWYEQKKRELSNVKSMEMSIARQDQESVDPREIELVNKKYKVERQALESVLEYGGQWTVILYDASEYHLFPPMR